ncbi:MAG: hypothetical protein QME81_00210 [bacterium]|nr:hypothetical protein [bacterium]
MAQPTRSYFATLTNLVKDVLDKISPRRLDYNPNRALWEVHGSLEQFDIRIKEIFTQSGRIYSYYVISEGEVVVGFDNYPDRRMLRQKYGRVFNVHLEELIPHKHGPRKMTFELTEEMSVEMFLNYLQELRKAS